MLRREDWYSTARSLPVHGKTRVRHGNERRHNLVIGHEPDHYWAYCQACHESGRVDKDHVLVLGTQAPKESTDLSLPRDMLALRKCEQFVQHSIARFLASKNMDALYLPELFYSEQRKRLLVQTPAGWLGRDLTGSSNQKWLSYNSGCMYLGEPAEHTIVVEDAFSWYKVTHSLSSSVALRGASVCALLGTSIRPSLMQRLVKRAKSLHAFLDGDKAGQRGAIECARRCKTFGVQALAATAPDGMDPKDMRLKDIRDHCEAVQAVLAARI